MENSLNILHYCIYKADYKLTRLFNKINPFMLIHKLPFQKRRYEKLGIDINEVMNKVYGDKRYGQSIIVSGGATISVLFLLIMSFAMLMLKIAGVDVTLKPVHFIAAGLLSYATCHLLVFKEEKYLRHFRHYENWAKAEKVKYGLFSIAFIIAVVLLFVFSL